MSLDVKARSTSVPEAEFYYTLDSLNYARDLLWVFEDRLKENARQLAFDAGRKRVTEEDMRQAAVGFLGTLADEVDNQGSDDA